MKGLLLVIFSAITLAGCRHLIKDNRKYGDYNVSPLVKGDATFLRLKDTAQAHLHEFLDSMKIYGPESGYRFMVKSDFSENDTHEHMWSQITGVKDGVLIGTFIDSAFTITNIKYGDLVKIKTADVEDWSVYDESNHRKAGDFSDEYLKSKRDN